MERSKLLKYEDETVLLKYKNSIGPQTRTGYIKAITLEVVIFWPIIDEEEIEIQIPFEDIEDIEELHNINLD